jgi:hypothetical protein
MMTTPHTGETRTKLGNRNWIRSNNARQTDTPISQRACKPTFAENIPAGSLRLSRAVGQIENRTRTDDPTDFSVLSFVYDTGTVLVAGSDITQHPILFGTTHLPSVAFRWKPSSTFSHYSLFVCRSYCTRNKSPVAIQVA